MNDEWCIYIALFPIEDKTTILFKLVKEISNFCLVVLK